MNENEILHTGLGTPLDPPSQSWLMQPGKGKFGKPCWNCYLRDPTSDKRTKMDGWMDGLGIESCV